MPQTLSVVYKLEMEILMGTVTLEKPLQLPVMKTLSCQCDFILCECNRPVETEGATCANCLAEDHVLVKLQAEVFSFELLIQAILQDPPASLYGIQCGYRKKKCRLRDCGALRTQLILPTAQNQLWMALFVCFPMLFSAGSLQLNRGGNNKSPACSIGNCNGCPPYWKGICQCGCHSPK